MGSLDERNVSLWVATSEESRYRPLTGRPQFDAIVIGGGITGLTTALLLQRDGMRVAVLEADRVASGVTGYTTAKVTALHDAIYHDLLDRNGTERTTAYASANAAGIERLRSIVAEEGISCELQRLDAYTYAESGEGAEAVQREAAACTEAGLPVELTSDVPLPFPAIKAVRLADQAAIHPRAYCLGLARAIHGSAGRVYERTRALEVEEKVRVCRVKTERGSISAAYVVVATQLPFMGDGRFYAKTAPTRSYAMAFQDPGGITDGMLISADEPVRSLRPATIGDARWLILGGQSHKVGHGDDTERHYAALEAWAAERLGLGAPAYRWSAQDYVSIDGMPYVGRLSNDHERVFVATGFRKWGMTNGTAAAMMIADAIAGRDNPWAFAFDATRTRPRQAAKKFIKESIDVAKHLVLDKVTPDGGSPDDLAPGEGAIATVGGETLAVSRDDEGRLFALSPDCTHMGCRVAWNTAERTWDCPCHGSRFAPDGTVVQGPANEPLERKEIPALGRR